MKFEKNDQLSTQAEAEQNYRAKKRNEYRPILEKLLFKGKVNTEDIAMEQAIEMDMEAERLIKSGEASTFSEAIQKLNQNEKFALKTRDIVEKEEFARARSLLIIKEIKGGEVYKAKEILEEVDDKKIFALISEIIKTPVTEIFIDCLKNKDKERVTSILVFFDKYINEEDLKKQPDEILKSPEIISEISKDIIYDFEWTTCKHSPYHSFKEVVDRYVRLGFFTYEEIIQSPIIKKMAKEGALHDLEYGFLVGVENLWKDYVEAGVLTFEEIIELSEIKNKAKEILKYALTSGPALSRAISSEKSDMVRLGIISEAESSKVTKELEAGQY